MLTAIERMHILIGGLREHAVLALAVVCFALLVALICSIVLHMRARGQMSFVRSKLAEEGALKEAAEKANRAKTEFLTRISHEIRTPMNSIMGFTDLALKRELNPELREYLDTVRTSSEWLMEAINRILDFARMEAGTFRLHDTEFLFVECVRSAIKFVEPAAEQKRLRIAFRSDPLIPACVCGDATRLRQVLVNLLDNAVKFTSTGSIMVSANFEAENADAVTVRMTIADTGMGILEEKQRCLFEPFRLEDGSLNRRYAGAGLGLAISSRLVAMMGGKIDVLSQIGAGTTFRFTVRLRKATHKEAPPSTIVSANPSRWGKPVSILVAEDNAVNLRLVTRLLESVGHQITPACNGREAVDLFTMGNFDLVLMDLEMPELDGFQASKAIRSREGSGLHVPIYALTARVEPEDRERCLAAGMDGYITKPIQVDELVKVVADIAGRKPREERSPVLAYAGLALRPLER